MQHCLQKTFALLWCATLFLRLPLSSHEMSDSSNGLVSSLNSGLGSIEDSQPSGSSSGSNLVKNSNGLTKQLIEPPPPKRHLEQSSESSGDEDGGTCNLTRDQQSRFHSTYPGVWNISDAVLEELDNDIQTVVDCAAPNDAILISTTRNIQPLRSIIISKNLAINSQSEGPLLRNRSIGETEAKVKFSCPSGGDLFIIRSAVTLANLIFEECKGTGNVMSVETRCYESSAQGTVHLCHLEFRELSLSEGRRLLESVQPSCIHLWMENVILRNNSCGASGCMSLSQNNTLRDVQVTGNQAMHSNLALESHTVFVLPVNSTSAATNVEAARNGARVFSVANATLTLKNSDFTDNAVDQDVGTSLGGSVLVSNDSTIRIRDSMFERNSGLNGGALYIIVSNLILTSCTFRENYADIGNGGAVYATNRSSLSIVECIFIENNAVFGAGVFSSESLHVLVMNTSFEENLGTKGAALYLTSGNTSIESCDVLQCNGSLLGNSWMTVTESGFVSESLFCSNNTNSRGACAFQINSSVIMNGVQFVGNQANENGGALHAQHLAMDISNASFQGNKVDEAGSAIHLSNGFMRLEDVTITDNSADLYGTVLIGDSSALFIRVFFFENSAKSYGGGLSFHNSNITVYHSWFENNSAGYSGAAIYASSNSNLSVLDTVLHNNSAASNGGGIYAWNCNVSLTMTNFTKNSGDNGGGCYFNEVNATFNHVYLDVNRASDGSGGGIYTENGRLNGESLTFQDNLAIERGGGIYASDLATMNMSKANFTSNNAFRSGGGIYVEDIATMSLLDVRFRNNTGRFGGGVYFYNVIATMRNLVFSSNRASDGSGGGIYTKNGRLNGESLTFQENLAVGLGGGIYASDLTAMNVSTSIFASNNAARRGGGIYGENVESMSLRDVRFRNNTSGIGGGVCFESINATVNKITLSKNRAIDGSGGGIHAYNGQLNGQLLTFKENQASESGGGIYGANSRLLSISEVRFDRNKGSTGGAISISKTTLKVSRSCVFTGNNATTSGGSIYHELSKSSISSCQFENSVAENGGALWIGEFSQSYISNCTFSKSMASSCGGGIYIYSYTRVAIMNSSFSRCESILSGGAVSLEVQSTLTVSGCKFKRNHATHGAGIHSVGGFLNLNNSEFKLGRSTIGGGGIYATNGNVEIHKSMFQTNNVADGIGGALTLHSSNATVRDTEFFSNNARNYAGIYTTNSTSMNATNISIHSNVARESGGGMGIESGSSLLCRCCQFRNNEAKRGGGITIWANKSMSLVAQLQDSTFANNTASNYGGGLFFIHHLEDTVSFNASKTTCSRIVLLNATFIDNIANVSGSAILTSDSNGVLVSCDYTKPEYDFIEQDRLDSLDPVYPKNICTSWTGNQIKTANPQELNVSTFGRHLSFSTINDINVRVVGDVESGFVIENTLRGDHLPVIHVKVLDAYGNGPAYTLPRKLEATMESPNEFFNGSVTLTIIDGSGNIAEIFIHSPPGNYSIQISPNAGGMEGAIIKVHVRECQVGEELTSRNYCQLCDAVSYNFNPMEHEGCSLCPSGATCETRYIVPKDGYWHKGPCHASVQECLIEEACTYGERQQKLKNYTIDSADCEFEDNMLKKYGEVLCKDGYKGPLCGSCSASHGLSVQFKCLECPHALGSVFTLIGFTLYLLAIAAVTTRGGLPLKLKKSRADTPRESLPSRTPSRASSDEQVVNLEMVAMISQDHVTSNDIQENEASDCSITQPLTQSNEPELTRWITTEILKVMINFLQVTASAASINVEWNEGILKMFEATEYVGALSSDALSRPIDCLISSDSASVRSMWRTCLNIFVPIVVMGIFVAMWGIITHREKKGMSYFWKRVILSVMVVIYIAYLGLTKLGVRVFYCVEVYNDDDNTSNSSTRYWAVDTSIKCYEKGHAGLVVVSFFVLLIVSISFPLLSAIYLFQNKAQPGQTDRWTHETMGFLYRAFKEKYVFWESVVMFRKACLSLTVVFSYPLGGQSQGLLALGVLLLCLYMHQTCFPYRQEFHKLNYYESGSLLVSSFTFILGQFFSIEQCTHSAKTLVEVLVITLNTVFFTFLLVVLLRNGMSHIRAVLKFKDFPIDDNTSWWRLLKLFIKSKKPKTTLPQD